MPEGILGLYSCPGLRGLAQHFHRGSVMGRFLSFAGLVLGVLATRAGSSSAQQFRNTQVTAPPIPQVQNNFNNVLQQGQNQKIIGYNVTGINGQGVVGQNGLPGTTASNIINGMNNGGGGLYGTTPPYA